MSLGSYILDGHIPVSCPDIIEWARWYETADSVVARTMLNGHGVSTVFLGIDHNWLSEGPPLLFETMVFIAHSGAMLWDQWRYSTWDQALAGHDQVVAEVRAKEAKPS